MVTESSGAGFVGDAESPRGGRPLGFTSRDDPFTGDRWTEDERSGDRGGPHDGETTPEQEAADLLMQAEHAQAMEPDYDFESAEGGNGSPYLENRQERAEPRTRDRDGHGAESIETGLLWTVGQSSGDGSRSRRDEPVQAQQSRAHDQGPQAVDAEFSGTLNGFFGGAPWRSEVWDGMVGPAQQVDSALDRPRERGSPTSDRIGMLETLVYQLMEQNEQLRREMIDTQSMSSGESGRGRVGPVQSLGRSTDADRSVAEGRGNRRSGESKRGKGLGGSQGKWAPTLQVFQPPWTNFSTGNEGSASSMPPEGPGDRILSATRALQSMTLQETPEVQVIGLKPSAPLDSRVSHSAAVGSEQPHAFPLPSSVSAAGIPSFSGLANSEDKGRSAVRVEAAPPPSEAVRCQRLQDVDKLQNPRVVTVMINGVPRSGSVNERGEVVVTSESPKYFEIKDLEVEGQVEGRVSARDALEYEGAPVLGPQARDASTNPFSPKASTPFAAPSGPKSVSPPPPPPPAPEVAYARTSRSNTRSPGGYRTGFPRRPSRSPNPSPPRARPTQLWPVNSSPVTPGGTKVPSGPPPATPVVQQGSGGGIVQGAQVVGSEGSEVGNASEASRKDFIPGERTYWELPVLSPPSGEPNPAMRCNDWVYKITPLMSDLAPRANIWCAMILKEAQAAYQAWVIAKPLERAKIVGRPSEELQGNAFTRIESRGVAMLSKALPSVVYEQALSCRNVSCVGLLFLTLRIYQPGGLNERAELLRGLTTLQVFDSPSVAVSGLQKWFRHLERARTMEISIPDSSLLLDSIDKCVVPILQAHPALNFRMHTVRMQLQLDTRPLQTTVEEYTRTMLAELELLAVAAPETNNAKRQRMAALAADGPKGKGWRFRKCRERCREWAA